MMEDATAPLDLGEELVWSGRPAPLWYALRRGVWFAVFGAMLLAHAIVFPQGQFTNQSRMTQQEYDRLIEASRPGRIFAGIAGICCILVGGWFAWRAFRTRYLLTNRRVVIDTAGPLPRRLSIPLEHVRFIERREKIAGPGDVIFAERWRASVDGLGLRGEGFIAIHDSAHVEGLVRAAIDQTFATRSRGPWQ
jgi:hypothetical protein